MSSSRALVAATPTSMARRAGAFAIDIGVGVAAPLMMASMAAGAVVGLGAMSGATVPLLPTLIPVLLVASCVGWALVYSAMQGGGASIGQRLTGLRLADADTGDGIGFGRAFGRNFVFLLAAVIIVGFFSPLFDRSARRQGWHDLAAGACVVDVRADRAAAARAGAAADAPPGAAPALAPHAPPAYGARVSTTVSADAPTGAVERIDAPELELTASTSAPGGFRRPAAAFLPTPDVDEAPVAASGTLWGQPAHAGAGHRVITVLTWDDGNRMAVYGRTVCGRNPDREGGVAVVALRDETLSVSKTHFEIGGDADGPWIIDRFSTNGTNLVRDDERIGLVPGLPAALRPGDRLEFGDRSAVVGGAA